MFRTSDFFFFASSLVAFVLANYLLLSGNKEEAVFVSLWVPTNLVLGIYFRNIATTSQRMGDE
jgi:hypothetical protein